MLKAVMGVFALVFVLSTTAAAPDAPLAATDLKAADIQATLSKEVANKNAVNDMPIRTVDVGGYNVGIGLVHRLKVAKGAGAASHDKVTEIYQVLEGSGTLVTGGTLTNVERREAGATEVTSINGPGASGSAIQGGTSRRIAKGDMVIIPAGTPHWWSEVDQDITYTVVRVDPSRVVSLK